MKKIIFALFLMLGSLPMGAQAITGLDEVALMGQWKASDYWGVWENLDYRWPVLIDFNDNKDSYIHTKRSAETEPTILRFNGYWLGGSDTGRYTLHLICRRDYDSNNTGLSMVNFVVKNFDGENLTIETYDGRGGATFAKGSAASNAVNVDASEASSTLYNLSGMAVKNPTTYGIYIQGDGKKIVK